MRLLIDFSTDTPVNTRELRDLQVINCPTVSQNFRAKPRPVVVSLYRATPTVGQFIFWIFLKLTSPNWKYALLSLILASCISIKPISMWFDNQLLVQQIRQTKTRNNSVGNRVAGKAIAWVGKSYKPGQRERCADFVRFVLRQSNVRMGITRKPWDAGKQYHNGSLMARSFFGNDIGIILTNSNQFQKGDLIGFTNTYGNFRRGAITHVGIYVGKGRIVDRSTMSALVRIRSLSSFSNSQIIGVRPYAYQK